MANKISSFSFNLVYPAAAGRSCLSCFALILFTKKDLYSARTAEFYLNQGNGLLIPKQIWGGDEMKRIREAIELCIKVEQPQ